MWRAMGVVVWWRRAWRGNGGGGGETVHRNDAGYIRWPAGRSLQEPWLNKDSGHADQTEKFEKRVALPIRSKVACRDRHQLSVKRVVQGRAKWKIRLRDAGGHRELWGGSTREYLGTPRGSPPPQIPRQRAQRAWARSIASVPFEGDKRARVSSGFANISQEGFIHRMATLLF